MRGITPIGPTLLRAPFRRPPQEAAMGLVQFADDVIKRGPGSKAKFAEAWGFAVDYEVEFGVVIGKTAKNVRQADAYDHVFAYPIINDVGSRAASPRLG